MTTTEEVALVIGVGLELEPPAALDVTVVVPQVDTDAGEDRGPGADTAPPLVTVSVEWIDKCPPEVDHQAR